MSFTDFNYVFIFLPIVLITSLMLKGKAKEVLLLIYSLLFYFMYNKLYFAFLILCMVITVFIGRRLAKDDSRFRKALFAIGIIINLGTLAACKVYNKIDDSFLLPLGVSFFTFKAISYLIDSYNHKIKFSDNPVHDALYLSIFTQIQSGPISRYNDFESVQDKDEIRDYRISGIYRFFQGFCKKVIIADVLAKVVNEIFATPVENISMGYAWLGAVCFSLQLFYDFAGYTDMAIGITGFLGFRCRENFIYPFMTESVSGFWKRWHISLSEWFRDYVYIPLGGSRRGKLRTYVNLFVVWLLTGLWHGLSWNFIIWGLGFYVLIAFERFTGIKKRVRTPFGKGLYRAFSLLAINLELVMFRAPGASFGISYIKRMFIPSPDQLLNRRAVLLLSDYRVFILAAVLFCFPVIPMIEKKLKHKRIYDVIYGLLLLAGFMLAVSFIVSGQNNPFLYGNF